ncbi:hypothetical protein GCWU000246_01407 [Jonquetella anthropi E3_33 E1]|nr:hypothetical protein GCWU000246_01407 [Jonquetella anthropi E3_33 E1]
MPQDKRDHAAFGAARSLSSFKLLLFVRFPAGRAFMLVLFAAAAAATPAAATAAFNRFSDLAGHIPDGQKSDQDHNHNLNHAAVLFHVHTSPAPRMMILTV